MTADNTAALQNVFDELVAGTPLSLTVNSIATIQILNPDIAIPASSDLYHVQGKILSIQSPANGIVGLVTIAPLSTIGGASTTDANVYPGYSRYSDSHPTRQRHKHYTSLYVSNTPNGRKYLLHVIGQVPANVVSNSNPTITVYRATCQRATDGQAIINTNAIVINAQRKQGETPFSLPSLGSLWNALMKSN